MEFTVSDPTKPSSDRNPRTFTAVVPKDFLIVSIGDSYASGEGNPDRAYGSDVNADKRVLWMDERCHRSMFAGPIQAGLTLIRKEAETPKVTADEGITVQTHGAFTIVSVACSGATVDHGIQGTYEGVVPLEALVTRDTRRGKSMRYLYQRQERIEAQDTQVMELLSEAGSDSAAIDALILSVGGNDVYFAALLLTLVLDDVGSGDAQMAMQEFVDEKLRALESNNNRGYPAVSKLRVTRGARQVLITGYPDPTYRCDEDTDLCYCHGTISGGILGFIMGLLRTEIEQREVAFVRKQLVRQLNSKVQQAAEKYDWRLVPVEDKFRGHGWCLRRSYDPYGSSEAWFRDVRDSDRFQGDIYGTMHPTWEGHQGYADGIHQAVKEGIERPIAVKPERVWPRGEKQFYKPPLTLCFEGNGAADADRRSFKAGGMSVATPIADRPNCLALEGAPKDPLKAEVRNRETKRRFEDIISGLTADSDAPWVSVTVASGVREQDCTSKKCWLREPSVASFLEVSDKDGSGVAEVTWQIVDDQGRRSDGKVNAPSLGRFRIADFGEGRHQLDVKAKDNVGNVAASEVVVGVDSAPPSVTEVSAYGYSFPGTVGQVTLPLVAGTKLEITLTASDNVSGMRRLTWKDEEIKAGGKLKKASLAVEEAPEIGAMSVEKWAVERPVAFPREGSAVQTLSFELADVAGNVTQLGVRVVKLPSLNASKGGSDPRTLREWRGKVTSGRVSHLLKNVIAPLTTSLASVPEATDPVWPVFAAWLNLAEGRFSPDMQLEVAVVDCSLSIGPSASTTAFALLKSVDDCLAVHRHDDRGKLLLQQLPEQLVGSKMIGQ